MAMLDNEMKYVAYSHRWIKELGLNDANLIGKSHYEVMPEIPDWRKEIHRRCLLGATEQSEADPFPRPDGGSDIMRWQIRPWLKSDGKIGGIIISTENITKGAQTEQRLRQSIKETLDLRKAIDRHSIITITDLKGNIQSANENFLKLSKYSLHEVVGQTHSIVNSGYHSKEFWQEFWSTISSGKVWQGDVKNQAKDGSIYWVATTLMPFFDDHGDITQYMSIRTDITEQKLKEMDHTFILNSLGIGTWTADLQTGEFQWDENMNKLYERIPEKNENALESWMRVLSSETREMAVQEINAAINGDREFDCAFQINLPSGKTRDIQAMGFVVRDKNGKPLKMHGINVDRSKEAELEKEILSEKAKALQAAKLASLGELAAGIGHEINNPLAIISGSVNLISKNVHDPDKVSEKIKVIEKSCARISGIVNGLRKFSRSSEGVSHAPHPLAEIIQEVLVLTEAKSKHDNTPVSIEIPVQGIIHCDQVAIGQVLINLINNAVDAVKEMPQRWVKIELRETKDNVFVRIIDSGNGIPESVRIRLFDPFYTTKKVGEGTGLGLSIAKGILEDHKGTITVLADYPHTCFELKFPRFES